MDNEKLKEYYLTHDYNCAETVLRLFNEEHHLGLGEDALVLAGGFGGGMGCGETCGALCGALMVLSRLLIESRAHGTLGFRDACGTYVRRFEEAFGSMRCAQLKAEHFCAGGTRCLAVVERGAKLLEAYLDTLPAREGC